VSSFNINLFQMTFVDIIDENNQFELGTLIEKRKNEMLVWVNGSQRVIPNNRIFCLYETDDMLILENGHEMLYKKIRKYKNIPEEIIENFYDHAASIYNFQTAKLQYETLLECPQIQYIPQDYRADYGLYKIVHFLNKDMCYDLIQYILSRPPNKKPQLSYGKNRTELYLNFDDEIIKKLIKIIKDKLGDRINLLEITALINKPCSYRQPLHRDFNDKDVQTLMIALHDIDMDMGPTQFLPGTNNDKSFEEYEKNELVKNPYYYATLRMGDCVVFDVTLLHCGTENKTNKDRIILSATYQLP